MKSQETLTRQEQTKNTKTSVQTNLHRENRARASFKQNSARSTGLQRQESLWSLKDNLTGWVWLRGFYSGFIADWQQLGKGVAYGIGGKLNTGRTEEGETEGVSQCRVHRVRTPILVSSDLASSNSESCLSGTGGRITLKAQLRQQPPCWHHKLSSSLF